MKIITIGRSPNNNINIDDSLVSRAHCQIIQDDNGNFRLIDTNSKNGTYINGTKRHGEVRLNASDIVRIGNTTLPWQTYFNNGETDIGEPDVPPGGGYNPPYPPPIGPDPTTQQSGLGTIALILSLVGAGILIYCAIRIMRWGIFALIGNASTFILVSVGINVLALILASIANYKKYKDSDAADIAEFISGFCIVIVIGSILYLKYGDPNLLNPLRNIK